MKCPKQSSKLVYLLMAILLAGVTEGFAQLDFLEEHELDGHDTGMRPHYLIDFDDDGDIDIFGRSEGAIIIFENDGDMDYDPHIIPEDGYAYLADVFPVDLDDDGDLDVVTAAYRPNNELAWWENDGDMNFERNVIDDEYSYPFQAEAVDIDEDGDFDIFCTAYGDDNFYWFENTGDVEFDRHQIEDIAEAVYLSLVDIDGDDDIDLAVATNRHSLYWCENDGDSNFEAHYISGNITGPVEILDLDDDGDMDILGQDQGESSLMFWQNDGEQEFDEDRLFYIAAPRDFTYGDINVDGNMDIITGSPWEDGLNVWLNNGDTEFSRHRLADEIWTGARGIVHGDLDGDGDNDITCRLSRRNASALVWYEMVRPELEHTDLMHDFGDVELFDSVEWGITLTNVGASPAIIEIGEIEDHDFSTDPQETFRIDPEEEVELTVTFRPTSVGDHEAAILLTTNAVQEELLILLRGFGITDYGDLFGRVTDGASGEPVADAELRLTPIDISVRSDEDGEYRFEHIPALVYQLTCYAEDYHTWSRDDVEVPVDDELELNIELLYSTCEPDPDRINISLEPEQEESVRVRILNRGNGSLIWSMQKDFPEGVEADPWEIRHQMNAEEIVEDSQLSGVVFAEGLFYISGGNNGDDVNKIYVLNNEGEYIWSFDQFNESRYGIRDLTYDGSLIWGADDGIFYGFTTDGEIETSFESPVDIDGRSIAWDSENQLLWTVDISTDIFGINRDGELVETIERPRELRTYGLGYWSDDPDGFNLYAFSRGEDIDIQVNKINMENGDIITVNEIDMGGGRPGGIQINGNLDPYNWMLIGIVQNPDRLALWQLGLKDYWLQVEPVEGVIEAEETIPVDVTLNTDYMPAECELNCDLVFTHNGVGYRTVIPVVLNVVGEPERFAIDLFAGWNCISAPVDPYNNDIISLWRGINGRGNLIIIRNYRGHFYWPEFNYNNIECWVVHEGYSVKLSNADRLVLTGETVQPDYPVPLPEGWSVCAYFPEQEVEAPIAFEGILDQLICAKDGMGNFYLPEYDFCNMRVLRRGRGYYVNVSEDIDLVWNVPQNAAFRMPASQDEYVIKHAPKYCNPPIPTGANMSVLIIGSHPGSDRKEWGIFSSDELCVGACVLEGEGPWGFAVWGDDPITDEIDGALEGQELELRLIDENSSYVADFNILAGKLIYETNSFCVLRLNSVVDVPSEFGIVSVNPNPFNSTTTITYSLPAAGYVELKLFDIAGREITTLINEVKQPGVHTTTLTASELPSGLYFVRLEASGGVVNSKIMLIK